MSARDSQRSKVYAAETAIKWEGKKFDSIAAAQSYIDRLLASAWWKRRCDIRQIMVRPGHGHRRATAGWTWKYGHTIQLPTWARTEYVVLHEVAHRMADCLYPGRAGHGPEYASVLLMLVRHKMGEESWRRLKESFVKRKVRHRVPSKKRRTLTPEQRIAAAERLAAARAAKAAKERP